MVMGAELTQSKSIDLNDIHTLTLSTDTKAHHMNITQIEN